MFKIYKKYKIKFHFYICKKDDDILVSKGPLSPLPIEFIGFSATKAIQSRIKAKKET